MHLASQVALVVKNLPANAGDIRDADSIPRENQHRKISWRRAWQPTPVFLPGEFHGQQACQATVHRVAKNWTQLKRLSTHASSIQLPGVFFMVMNICATIIFHSPEVLLIFLFLTFSHRDLSLTSSSVTTVTNDQILPISSL